MHGGSYAGGIQFVAAAIDRRIDAITPSIAWHSLTTSLYRAETVKGGWSSLLYAAG
jgi:ABC-2 type transport system ATP-binding protein